VTGTVVENGNFTKQLEGIIRETKRR
jgi:hypothetical protein